jgi:hypothetical protein
MKPRSTGLAGLALLLMAVGAAPAGAEESFRCQGRLVSKGDGKYDVHKKCGDPDAVTQRTDKRKLRERVRRWIGNVMEEVTEEREVEVIVQEWTYDLGPQRFVRVVDFENDRVVAVHARDYGHQK